MGQAGDPDADEHRAVRHERGAAAGLSGAGFDLLALRSLGICSWVLVLTVLLTPVTWLGSPQHLRAPAMFALVSVVLGAALMLVQMMVLPPAVAPVVPLAPVSLSSFCLGLSTIVFSFTGVSTFPTIQLDMADRARFSRAAAAGFAGLCMVYVPVATLGYVIYGDQVRDNITENFTAGPLLIIIQLRFDVSA
ncbi:proton-coupled amino acid transporter 4-like [Pollicipes pollicipes]|uniref:proton-coupled amino acid transporter 4-like n=1 Tax=Pollicipes pollicipes TaxID=41117 RepID=UPI001884E63E|nr:proton-coupled amino acid transporter 4-like [Pollicipes pollicipes]